MQAVVTAISSVMVAQAMKVPLEYSKTGKWNIKTALKPGGMPSSHSAGVTSLATFIGFKKGFRSPEFAIAAMLGMIVMYDAAGVRYHAGETAVAVNELEESMEHVYKTHPEMGTRRRNKELKERLGHLPSEVVGGAFLGVALGTLGYFLCRK
jgi:uncharacterized protein